MVAELDTVIALVVVVVTSVDVVLLLLLPGCVDSADVVHKPIMSEFGVEKKPGSCGGKHAIPGDAVTTPVIVLLLISCNCAYIIYFISTTND